MMVGGPFLILFNASLTLNKARFEEDSETSQTVAFELSSNNILASHADTPVHHFNNLIHSLHGCRSDLDRNRLLTFARAQMASDVGILLFKHKDIIDLFAKLALVGDFGSRGLTPKQLVEAKKSFWGVSGISLPYISWFSSPPFSCWSRL